MGMCLNTADNRLFVTQSTANRTTVYDVAAITDGENAVNVLGQPDFATATAGTRQAGMNGPNGCLVDGNNMLYVLQATANRVSLFDANTINNGENAVGLIGQSGNDVNPPDPVYVKGLANNVPYKLGLSAPQGVALDTVNHRLFVADTANHRVLSFNLNNSNLWDDVIPDGVLGQQNFWTNTAATTQSGLSSPISVAFDSAANQLYITDLTNNRIIIHDTATIVDGQDALAVLGQPFFTTTTAATTQFGVSAPRNVAFDSTSGQLYVADATNNRVLIFSSGSSSAPSGGGDTFHFFGF